MEDVHRETDIERLMQSTVPSSSPILNVELIKIYDTNNVKLTLNDMFVHKTNNCAFLI